MAGPEFDTGPCSICVILKITSPTIVIGPGGVGDRLIAQVTILELGLVWTGAFVLNIVGVRVKVVFEPPGIVMDCCAKAPVASLTVNPKLEGHRLLKILLDWNVVPFIE